MNVQIWLFSIVIGLCLLGSVFMNNQMELERNVKTERLSSHKIVKRQYYKPAIDGTWLGSEKKFLRAHSKSFYELSPTVTSFSSSNSSPFNVLVESSSSPSPSLVDTTNVGDLNSDNSTSKLDAQSSKDTKTNSKISVRDLSVSMIGVLNRLIKLLKNIVE